MIQRVKETPIVMRERNTEELRRKEIKKYVGEKLERVGC